MARQRLGVRLSSAAFRPWATDPVARLTNTLNRTPAPPDDGLGSGLMINSLDQLRCAYCSAISPSIFVARPNAISGSGGRGRRWRAAAFRLSAVLLAVLPFILAEAGLRLFGVGRPEDSADPLSGFNQRLPLFVRQGSTYRTAKARELFFNPQEFAATKPRDGVRGGARARPLCDARRAGRARGSQAANHVVRRSLREDGKMVTGRPASRAGRMIASR